MRRIFENMSLYGNVKLSLSYGFSTAINVSYAPVSVKYAPSCGGYAPSFFGYATNLGKYATKRARYASNLSIYEPSKTLRRKTFHSSLHLFLNIVK